MTTAARPWIISRTQDLLWFQGSVLAGVLLLAVFLALPPLHHDNYSSDHPAVWLLLFWGVIFDGSHVMATYARTYFAADVQSRSGLPGAWSLGWLLVGPLLAVVDYFGFTQQASVVGQSGLLFGFFLAAAYLWAYYHLIRQHYGFLSLYRRRAGLPTGLLVPDALFLWVGSAYPFVRYNLSEAYKSSGLPVTLPDAWLAPLRWVLDGSVLVALAVILVIGLRQARRDQSGFGPRHCFLLIVVGFSNLTFALLDNLLVIAAVLTIFHNLQYHRIVWQYERGQQRVPMGSLPRYAAFALGLGLLWYVPRIVGVAETHSDLWRNVLVGLAWGVAFHHYHVDARIWRVQRQPAVGEALDRGAA